MAEMGMMDHIAAHSVQVCLVASKLADLLWDRGIKIDRRVVYSAALLHDITKTRSFETGEDHAATGAELLRSLGYPLPAGIVAQHVRLETFPHPLEPPGEAEIVNYADKRVIHDRVGSLEDRRRYIIDRYGRDPVRRNWIRRMFQDTFLLEMRIFSLLDIAPDELGALVKSPYESTEVDAFRYFALGRRSREKDSTGPAPEQAMP